MNEEKLNNLEIDPVFVIREAFLGYKFRKKEHKLYDSDQEIPTNLIKLYYGLLDKRVQFDSLKRAFVQHYIHEESKIEGIDAKEIHSKVEVRGLEAMYEYIHSPEIDYMFNVYTLKELHEKLFSFADHPECAGFIRNDNVYLPGTGMELCDWRDIRNELNKLDKDVIRLYEVASKIDPYSDINGILKFIDECVELKCKLIKVHPFFDGNGRVIRGLINKLFETAGLPPIYIKDNERTEYHKAMNLANCEGNYASIKQFYKYKICDSIVELDINERIKINNSNEKGKMRK